MEFALGDPLTTIGRARGNSVALADVSVSRRHSRLELQRDSWIIVDEGSGNGTRVNGRPVQRHRLRHGDEIALGDTALRFVEPGGVLVWAAEGTRGQASRHVLRRALAFSSAAVLVAAVAILGALAVRRHRLAALAETRARTEATHALAQDWLREGAALLEKGSWVEGRDKLRIAAELDASDPEIARALERVEAEVSREQSEAEARSREASSSALESRPAPAAQAPPKRTAAAARQAAARRELRAVLDAYLRGDVQAALDLARTARGAGASRLAHPLARLAAAYQEGLTAQDSAAGLRSLELAAETDRAVAGGKDGRIARDVRKALAARHLLLALELSADEDLPRAAAHLRAAAREDPSNPDAERRLRQVADRAKELYLRGYLARDEAPEEARQAFAIARDTLSPEDETAQKAARWLEKLEGKGVD
jgi:pSer/pThr/pTyr-binding forkhead associated (FHA) protein